jgi:hypothetical protein
MELLHCYPAVVLALLKELSYRLYHAQKARFLEGRGGEGTPEGGPAVTS